MVTQAATLATDFSQSIDTAASTEPSQSALDDPSAGQNFELFWIVQRLMAFAASRSLGPAYPPSAKVWRSIGCRAATAFNTSGAPSRS